MSILNLYKVSSENLLVFDEDMQLTELKISNLLSYPYVADLSQTPGVVFHNRKTNNVHVMIGPNGAGKSGFLHIFKQLVKVGFGDDYLYNDTAFRKKEFHQVISLNPQYIDGLHPHFSSPKKKSQILVHVSLTDHDYENMQYISKHADMLNMLIKKYSTLDIVYPSFSHQDIHDIPSALFLEYSVDFSQKIFVLNKKKLSPIEQFVVLYLKTLELVEICIDIYNRHESTSSTPLLLPLKHTIAFVDNNRSLKNIPHIINPATWTHLVGDKDTPTHHLHSGLYLCVKKLWNIMSKHGSLTMTKKDIANYPERLHDSEFFVSLSYVIKKYLNKTLLVEYHHDLLELYLVDEFGLYLSFAQLSDGEQSLLSMIFTLYGYDLKHGIAVIDEPEIHFHPQMQKSFSRMMEKISINIGTQFIVSTYSPLFINESNISNVYRFSKIKGQTRVKSPFPSLSSDESSLVHLLKFENLSKIFFVNKIIMVEGETDAYFFEFYLRYLHTLPQRKHKIADYEVININGKGSYRLWSKFLARFGLQSYFIGDWDNIVDYGFMTQMDLNGYYKQARSYYAGLKKTKKTHRHYNRLVDTIRNLFPQKYKKLVAAIDGLYDKRVFILKKGDIETYLGMPEKGLDKMVKFCHYVFDDWMQDPEYDSCREEFEAIFKHIFS